MSDPSASPSSTSISVAAPSSASSYIPSWLSSPFATAASTLKSLTSTNLRDSAPVVAAPPSNHASSSQSSTSSHQQQKPTRHPFKRHMSRHQSVPGGVVVEGQTRQEASRRNSHGGLQYHQSTIGTPQSAASTSSVSSTPIHALPSPSPSSTPSTTAAAAITATSISTPADAFMPAEFLYHPSLNGASAAGPRSETMSSRHNSTVNTPEEEIVGEPGEARRKEHQQLQQMRNPDLTAIQNRRRSHDTQNGIPVPPSDMSSMLPFASTAMTTPTKSLPPADSFHTPYHQQQPAAPWPTAIAATPNDSNSTLSMRPPMHSQLTQHSLQAAFDRAVSAPASSLPSASSTPSNPIRTLPSIPDLSSFSSANFDASTDEEEQDDGDTLNALGLSGISIPFFSSRTTAKAPTPPPAEPIPTAVSSSSSDTPAAPQRNIKLLNFQRALLEDQIDLSALRKMSWNGIPAECRATVWKLLLGYLPVALSRREITLQKRRAEYSEYLNDFYFCGLTPDAYYEQQFTLQRSENDQEILKQIRQDVPRTSPTISYFKFPSIQLSLERILYIFAIRHTASGYVQGMNDLVTPFWTLFVKELYGVDVLSYEKPITTGAATTTSDTTLPSPTDTPQLTLSQLLLLEADCYFCLSFLIDAIQDNYTFAQPGIQRMVYRLKELVRRIDNGGTSVNGMVNGNASTAISSHSTLTPQKMNSNTSTPLSSSSSLASSSSSTIGLHAHLEHENIQFLHFSFRWMTCLLMRELRLSLILRLWDSYLSEEPNSIVSGFKNLHVYVCAAFLMHWKDELKAMDFQQLIQFLQKLPTEEWTEKQVETLLAQAHVYQSLFQDAQAHLLG